MWKAGVDVKAITNNDDDDDWETDPDFVVSVPPSLIAVMLSIVAS